MHPDLLLIFSGGLLGSAHCVGMCGPFALSIGASASNWRANLIRQATFSMGRIATYTSAGAIAGYVGSSLTSSFARVLPIQAVLAIVAGAVLVAQGLHATGVIGGVNIRGQHPCLMPKLLHAFLMAPGLSGAFFAGVFTGFLPCGLVYAFLALASATSSMLGGWLVMLAFGLGTMPVMIATGLGSGLLTLAIRRKILAFAGWCVLVAGVVSVARGVGFLELASTNQNPSSSSGASVVGENEIPKCPCCPD